MSNYDNGIVVGFIGGKDYVSQDNGDGTHSLICPIGDVPEIKRNHDRLEKESAELREFAMYCQGFLGCEESKDSIALYGITIKAKELLNQLQKG